MSEIDQLIQINKLCDSIQKVLDETTADLARINFILTGELPNPELHGGYKNNLPGSNDPDRS